MKTRVLKRFLITSSIVLSISYVIVLACADVDWGLFEYSNFTPDLFVTDTYTPLLYSTNEMFYGIGYDDKQISKFNDEIKSDWTKYLENKLKPDQINYFLLSDSSTEAVEAIYNSITKNTKNAIYLEWRVKMNLNDQKVKDFIEFLHYAKEVEISSTTISDPWSYDNKKETPKVDATLISQIEKKYQSTTDAFLKNRYWFQSIKVLFYSSTKNDAISFFEKTKNDMPKNTLYYRAIAYIAGVYKQNKDYAQANYNYSIVFDKCPEMRVTTAYNFHPQSDSDWKASLDLAKTNDEKAALWAMLGFYADPAKSIDEIYRLNPKSPHLDFLITRFVNKLENDIPNQISESISKYKSSVKGLISNSDITMLTNIAQSEKTSKPYLWNLAAGYLQTLNGNYSLAKTLLTKAEKQIPQSEAMKNQLRLLKFVNSLSEMNTINAANENILLPELQWLYNQKGTEIRYDAANHWSKQYISALYKGVNNIIYAEMFNTEKTFYQDNEKIDMMINTLSKTNKTGFEKLAESVYPIKLDDIYEYLGITYAFNDQAEKAFDYMGKANGLNAELLLGNPFNGNIQDCHDCEHLMTQKTKFSKLRFVEIIKIMETKVANGEDLFNNYLLLGNSFYNMSYYGNARYFYNNKIFDTYDKYYENIIYSISTAKKYYKKALAAAANDEQRAKCSYMLAKCERNQYYIDNNLTGWYFDDKKVPDFKEWDGFNKLKTKYSATKYYKDVIKECGYFRSYVNKK